MFSDFDKTLIQILIVIFTIYLTKYVESVFNEYKEREEKYYKAVSNLRKLGYISASINFHKIESEIRQIYFQISLNSLDEKKQAISVDEIKRLIDAQNRYRDQLVELNGEISKLLFIIESITSKQEYLSLDPSIKKILLPMSMTLSKNLDTSNPDKLVEELTMLLRTNIDSQVKKPFNELHERLSSIKINKSLIENLKTDFSNYLK